MCIFSSVSEGISCAIALGHTGMPGGAQSMPPTVALTDCVTFVMRTLLRYSCLQLIELYV